MDFINLLEKTQQYISAHYAAALTNSDKISQLKTYIEKYLRDTGYSVEGYTLEELTDKLYCEMAEYSILTKYLGRPDVEEINVNGWNDVAVTYVDGRIEKSDEHFLSPQHATDIVKRLLHHSGMIIDNATPMSQGHLPNNTRITALKEPLVDEDRGISVSIRLLHPSRVTREQIVKNGTATRQMIDFLCMCLNYGVSFVVASLRFNPDVVVVGEIRDEEAYSAVEASLTGHTVVSTIHARMVKGTVADTVTTDENGKAESKELYLGKYVLIETKAPAGMVFETEPKAVSLEYADETVKVTVSSVALTNKRQKANITINKQLESDVIFRIGENEEIKNVVFGLFAAEDITAADGSIIPQDGLLGYATPDSEGNAVFTADIPYGSKLYVKEIRTDSHYLLSDEKYYVSFDIETNSETVNLYVNDGTPLKTKS